MSASSAIGKTVNFAGNNPNSPTSKIKNELSNGIKDYQNATPAQKNAIISNMSGKISGVAQGLSSSILNKTYTDLAPQLNQGMHDLYKDVYGKILATTQNTAIAKSRKCLHKLRWLVH